MRYLLLCSLVAIAQCCFGQSFRVGDKVDMYSTDKNYYAGSVVEVSGDKYRIRFDAYDASSDQWVVGANLVRGGRVGDRIVVVTEKASFFGTIQEVQNTKYKVKYDGYPDSYELVRSQFSFATAAATTEKNVTQNSNANQAISTTTGGYTVGMQVQALQRSTWYLATIKEIRDGKYLVKYEGYNEEEWLPKENLRAKPALTADKLKPTTGKTYVRSIRWIATGYTEISWYFLGDNGVIVVDPVHGTNPINMTLEQTDNFKNVGYYSIANNQISIKWLNGKTMTLGLTYKNGDITEMDAGGIMVRQKGLPQNYKLSGTFSGTMSYGSVGSSSTYVFGKDGSISSLRSGSITTGDAAANSTTSKKGTYSIKGNTLFVTYNDGSRETANIGVFTGVADKLVLNGNWLTAQ